MNRHVMKAICCFLAAICMGGFCLNGASADVSVDYSPVVKHRLIRVGMFPLAGYHDYVGDKLVGGYGYDYLQMLDNYACWEYEFTPKKYRMTEMQKMLESGRIDMLTGLQKTPEREAKFAFSKYPVGHATTMLTVKAGNKRFLNGDYTHWNGMRVGMLGNGSPNEHFAEFAKRKGFMWTPVYYETNEKMLCALMAGDEIDAVVASDIRKIENEWILEKFDVSPFYILVRKNDQALLAEINAAQEQMVANVPALPTTLRRKYYSATDRGQIAYTPDERTFVRLMEEQKHEFVAIMNPDRKPLSYVQNGEYRGLLKDIADEMIRRSGLKIRFLILNTREEFFRACADENVDLVFDHVNDYLRAAKTKVQITAPYFESPCAIIHRKDCAGTFQSFATVRASNIPELVEGQFAPDVKIVPCANLKEAIDAVRDGLCDATYQHTRTAEEAMLHDNSGLLTIQYLPELTNFYCVGVRNSRNPLLFSVMEKAVKSIDNAFIRRTSLNYDAKFVPRETLAMTVHRHLALISFIVLGVFLLLIGILWFAFHSRKRFREEKNLLLLTIESANDGVISTDRSGKIKMINSVAEQTIGITAADALGKPVETVFKPLDPLDGRPKELPVFEAIRKNVQTEMTGNAYLLAVDGSRNRRISCGASPIHTESGKVIGALLVFHDITEKIRRQEEIKTELSQWNAVSRIARIYRFRFNFKTRDCFSYVPDEIWPNKINTMVPAWEWVYSEDVDNWYKEFHSIVSGKQRNITMNYRVLQNGRMRYFQQYMERDGDTDFIFGVVQEITNVMEIQKKQEAAMLLWQNCIDMVPLMMFVKSAADLRYIQCNGSFAAFFETTPDKIVGKNDEELFAFNPELCKKFIANDKDVLAEGKLRTVHESGCDPQGRIHYVKTVKVPAQDVNGEPILICMAIDETDEYLQKLDLQNLISNRDSAAKIANVATYRTNYKTWEVTGSSNIENYWPIINGRGVPLTECVMQEDVATCEALISAVINDRKKEVSFTCRRQREDGIHHYRLFMRKDSAIPDTLTGLIQDITEFVQEKSKAEALNKLWISVANVIPAILFVKDADDDYRYLYVNKNLELMLGRSADEIIGHRECEFMREEDALRIQKQDHNAMQFDHPTECYEIIRDANNTDHHFRSFKIPSVNEFGHRVMIQMTTDETETHELAEVRKIVSDAFEKLFFTDDLETGIHGVLKSVCEFVGFSRAYVCCIDDDSDDIHLFATYLMPGEKSILNGRKFTRQEASKQHWYQEMLQSHKGDSVTLDFTNKDDAEKCQRLLPLFWEAKDEFDIRGGSIHFLEVNGRPWGYVGAIVQHTSQKNLSDNEHMLLSTAATIIELAITRKRSFLKLQIAMEEAKAAAVAKSNFLATMSHEIRTPLNSVLGFADLLKDPHIDPEDHKQYLQNISNAGNVLLGLINDILDLSKLSANKMVFVQDRTNLLPLVSQLGMFFSPKCRAKGIHFFGVVPPDYPDVWIDKSRIRQLLFNLIGNAVKFTDTGSITVKVGLQKDTPEECTLVISVADTGAGIAPNDIAQLFDPFYQAKAVRGTATGNNGTGLGLSICQNMLEHMGGKLSVESTVGKGSIFIATIPHVKYCERTNEEEAEPQPDRVSRRMKDFSKLSVLLVDDVPMNLMVLKAMLKHLEVSADTAANAKEALEKMARKKFDFVLTDLWMPGLNGAELAMKIRHDLKDKAPRIAVVTADVEGKEHFDFSVFDAILTKPITPQPIQNFFENS